MSSNQFSHLWSSASWRKTGSYWAVPLATLEISSLDWLSLYDEPDNDPEPVELPMLWMGSRSNIVCVSSSVNRMELPRTRTLNADSSAGSNVVAIMRYLPGSREHLWLICLELVYCEFSRDLCFLKKVFGRHSVIFCCGDCVLLLTRL